MAHSEGVRLQKVLSQAGIASRRVAERMIVDGRVDVDGLSCGTLRPSDSYSRSAVQIWSSIRLRKLFMRGLILTRR